MIVAVIDTKIDIIAMIDGAAAVNRTTAVETTEVTAQLSLH